MFTIFHGPPGVRIPPSPQMNSLPRIRGAFFMPGREANLFAKAGGDKKWKAR